MADNERQRLLALCDELLNEADTTAGLRLVECDRVLQKLLQPPVLHPLAPGYVPGELERGFERAYLELQTHCGVPKPGEMSLFSFVSAVEYFEGMVESRK